MKCYDLGGLQLWTFNPRGVQKRRALLNWNPADNPGATHVTRKVAASILRTGRKAAPYKTSGWAVRTLWM